MLSALVLAICAAMTVILVLYVYAACVLVLASSDCLDAGYPSAKIDYRFETYCIKRVDQTDVVVPLRDVKK